MAYLGILFWLLLIGCGLPIPEDVPLLAAGVLAHEDVVLLVPVMIVGYVGVLGGDSILYWAGHHYGRRVVHGGWLGKFVSKRNLERFDRLSAEHGLRAVFYGRFLPGIRTPVFLAAGVAHIPYRRFLLVNGVAALVSVPLWVGLGYYFAEQIEEVRANVRWAEEWLLTLLVLSVFGYLAWKFVWSRRSRGL